MLQSMASAAGNDSRGCKRASADVTEGGGPGDDSDDHSDQTEPPLLDPMKLSCLPISWAGDAWARGAALDVLAVFTPEGGDMHVEVETFLFMTDFPEKPLALDGYAQACNTNISHKKWCWTSPGICASICWDKFG